MGSQPHRSISLPLACALAYAGAVVGYTPPLTLLLPVDVARIAGDGRYAALALVLGVGAVTAGIANLAFGWLSDATRRRGHGRRGWIAAGLAGVPASFAMLAASRDLTGVVLSVAAFQIAINAILAPLMALVAEEVPPARRGLTTGLFAAGPLLGALVSLAVANPAAGSDAMRLVVVAAITAVCLAPLLVMPSWPPSAPIAAVARVLTRRDLMLAWTARLLVQVAGTVLFADLVYLLEQPGPGAAEAATMRAGAVLFLANLLPPPIAIALGRLCDRRGGLRASLVAAAGIAAAGLALMAISSGWPVRATGFLVFAIGWGVFLPLQIGFVMRLLSDPDRRGRDLGLLNLANTLPTLAGQGLTWWLATPRDAAALLGTLAAITLAGGGLMLAVRSRR